MNPERLEALSQYLRDKAAHSCTVTPAGVRFLTVEVQDLPPDIRHNTKLVERLNQIATLCAASMKVKAPAKPQRIENKIIRLMQDLKDPHIRELLDAHLSPDKAGELIDTIEDALGYRETAFCIQADYAAPSLTASELAYLVRDALRSFGFAVNASNAGLLVKTIKAIGTASGFKTNAAESARALF